MDARLNRAAFLVVTAFFSLGASYRTTNFVVTAPTKALAEKIGKSAEKYRKDLAIEWLGKPMSNWSQPCPIAAQVAPSLGAGGATSFLFDRGEVFGWRMDIQGSEERILDSVLPHEVTHTIFASHFRRPLPRWADEGACTTVEHPSERLKQQNMLISFLRTGRGIAFSQMFQMKDYPQDVLPLYSQGYSLARYLIQQGGKRKFLAYVGDGMKTDDWTATTKRHYKFANLGTLQSSWLEWVKQGSPALATPAMLAKADARLDAQGSADHQEAADDLTYRGQSADEEAGPSTFALAADRGASDISTSLGPVDSVNTLVPPSTLAETDGAAGHLATHEDAAAHARNQRFTDRSNGRSNDHLASAGAKAGSVYGPSLSERRNFSSGLADKQAGASRESFENRPPVNKSGEVHNQDRRLTNGNPTDRPQSGRRVVLEWSKQD